MAATSIYLLHNVYIAYIVYILFFIYFIKKNPFFFPIISLISSALPFTIAMWMLGMLLRCSLLHCYVVARVFWVGAYWLKSKVPQVSDILVSYGSGWFSSLSLLDLFCLYCLPGKNHYNKHLKSNGIPLLNKPHDLGYHSLSLQY